MDAVRAYVCADFGRLAALLARQFPDVTQIRVEGTVSLCVDELPVVGRVLPAGTRNPTCNSIAPCLCGEKEFWP